MSKTVSTKGLTHTSIIRIQDISNAEIILYHKKTQKKIQASRQNDTFNALSFAVLLSLGLENV